MDFLRKIFALCCATLSLVSCITKDNRVVYKPADENSLRAPAYPLLTIDPYTSVWSFCDKLNDEPTRHWTGRNHPLVGAIRVDGETYRFMGRDLIKTEPVIGTAKQNLWDAMYTFSKPEDNWMQNDYVPQNWQSGKAAFGTPENPHATVSWNKDDIWVRRTFDWSEDISKEDLFLQYSHDDNVEIFLNGEQIAVAGNGLDYDLLQEIPANIASSIKPHNNVLAAHCHNNGGGAYIDFGISRQIKDDTSFNLKAEQKSVVVMPTQTYYTFECGGVLLDLIFTSPAVPTNLELVAAPYNYVTYQVRSQDEKKHDVQVYFEATPLLAVNTIEQPVEYSLQEEDGFILMKTGTVEQPILQKKGDDLRIDWGYFCMAAPNSPRVTVSIDEQKTAKTNFLKTGILPGKKGLTSPDMQKQMTVLAYSDNLGMVGEEICSGHLVLGYDDIYSIQYFGDNRMAYWKHNGSVTIEQALKKAFDSYSENMQQCNDFDKKLMEEARNAGGQQYAELCALVYRQTMAAHKLVTDSEGNLMYFSKENFSNGSIGTVDITYPSSPMYLCYNTDLLKGMMTPIFEYSHSGRWKKPFAAHDVGTYPHANGQTYGGDMPVEESGNMLILTAAIAKVEGNAEYAAKYWNELTAWADYLKKEGLDPANQLCTDDFAGHFAHNTNLSIKAIMGVASYAYLARMLGKVEQADSYESVARNMASKWVEMADDGDHYRLTFDQPGTWSQKYNLIWDRLLGFNLFPEKVADTEMAFYKEHINCYGLPLDNREDYSKSDWILWTACLTGNDADFCALVQPVWNYANETTSRVPLSDWHYTSTGNQRGFQARSVVGGYYMNILAKRMVR